MDSKNFTEQQLTQNIKPANDNLDILRNNFPQCFRKGGSFDFEKFRAEIESNEINFSTESYSLDWLGKSYARIRANDETATRLCADTAYNLKTENQNAQNVLIKGDNLEVLKHLSNAYGGKIKVIYIDPPYNTGGDDFVYNDTRKYSVKQLEEFGLEHEKAQRIFDFTTSSGSTHSAWLTFIYPRLYIAKKLLQEDGVIFVSIDDNEQAQLKLMMDEVFGEENFVSNFVWKSKSGGANDSKLTAVDHEYMLAYAKNSVKTLSFLLPYTSELNNLYTGRDKYYETRGAYRPMLLQQKGLSFSQSLTYEIEAPDGSKLRPEGDGAIWRWSKEKFLEGVKNDFIEFKQINGEWKIYTKQYFFIDYDGNIISRGKIIRSVIDNIDGRLGTRLLQTIFNEKVFSNPKPIELVKLLLKAFSTQDSTILDFFAGSGTTAHAVMQLNAEDGGNRKFILVQLPEVLDPKNKNQKAAYDFVKNELGIAKPTIFDITKERIIRAAAKISNDLDAKYADYEKKTSKDNAELEKKIKIKEKELELEGTKEAIEELKNQIADNNQSLKALKEQHEAQKKQNVFKVFETAPLWDNYGLEHVEDANELKFPDYENFSEEDKQSLLLTWKTYDGFKLTQDLEKIDLGGYTAYYIDKKIYLMYKGFTVEHLKALFEKVDSDKNFEATEIIIYGYVFDSKIQREMYEAQNSLSKNKQSAKFEIIVRY